MFWICCKFKITICVCIKLWIQNFFRYVKTLQANLFPITAINHNRLNTAAQLLLVHMGSHAKYLQMTQFWGNNPRFHQTLCAVPQLIPILPCGSKSVVLSLSFLLLKFRFPKKIHMVFFKSLTITLFVLFYTFSAYQEYPSPA